MPTGSDRDVQGPPVSSHQNSALIRRFVEAINDHDDGALDVIVAEDYRQHDETIPDGRTAFKKYVRAMRERWPNVHIELEHVVSEQERVAAFTKIVATEQLVIRAANVWLVRDGQLAEHWEIADAGESLNSLGRVRRSEDVAEL